MRDRALNRELESDKQEIGLKSMNVYMISENNQDSLFSSMSALQQAFRCSSPQESSIFVLTRESEFKDFGFVHCAVHVSWEGNRCQTGKAAISESYCADKMDGNFAWTNQAETLT